MFQSDTSRNNRSTPVSFIECLLWPNAVPGMLSLYPHIKSVMSLLFYPPFTDEETEV